jgi:hypothetical protein
MLRTTDGEKPPNDEEVDMVNVSAALAVAFLLASAGIASAQPTWNATSERVFASGVQRYDGVSYPNNDGRFCYLPSSPCGNNHRVTN